MSEKKPYPMVETKPNDSKAAEPEPTPRKPFEWNVLDVKTIKSWDAPHYQRNWWGVDSFRA